MHIFTHTHTHTHTCTHTCTPTPTPTPTTTPTTTHSEKECGRGGVAGAGGAERGEVGGAHERATARRACSENASFRCSSFNSTSRSLSIHAIWELKKKRGYKIKADRSRHCKRANNEGKKRGMRFASPQSGALSLFSLFLFFFRERERESERRPELPLTLKTFCPLP
jgi:hypothetical protein